MKQRIILQPEYQAASGFIARLPEIFEQQGEMIYSGRNVVKRFHTDYGVWIVKRYRKPNIFQRLAYTFWRKSKAERAFLYAEKLLSAGIDTPAGIGYIECREHGLFRNGYFISAECTDAPLFPILIEKADFDKKLATALAEFFVRMHRAGFLHGDPNLRNILYHTDRQGKPHFSVIDTNRSLFTSNPTPAECLDNLKRISHRRDLLQYIVREYATLRGWDPAQSVCQVTNALDKFEKRKEFKHSFQRVFGRH